MKYMSRNLLGIMRKCMLVFIGLGLPFYLFFHMIAGERSISALGNLQKEYEMKQASLQEMDDDNAKLAQKIKLLQNNHVDQDLLEELARKKLGLIYKNEVRLKN